MKNFLQCSVIACLTSCLAGCWDTGSGEKVGTVIKLSHQGAFVKTWEAEIIRGGLNSGSGVMGQSFHFTIESDALVKEIQNALDTQQEIKIFYNSEAITFLRSDSDSHFLSKIEQMRAVASPPQQEVGLQVNGLGSQDGDLILQVVRNQQALLAENQKLLERLAANKK